MPEGDPNQGNQFIINAETLGEYAQDPAFQSFIGKPGMELLKSFKSAQSMIGADKVVVPSGKLDNPENWGALFDRLGRPKELTGYEFARPELPDGMAFNEDFENAMRPVFHYLGLLPWQAKGLSEVFTKYQLEQYSKYSEGQSKQTKDLEDALVKKLGTKEKYDEYMKNADAALKKFGKDPNAIKAFSEKYGNDPLVIEIFGEVANAMMEAEALRGGGGNNLGDSVETAKAQVKDIMSNKENKLYAAYWDNKHPQHRAAVEEVSRLHEIVHGNEAIKTS